MKKLCKFSIIDTYRPFCYNHVVFIFRYSYEEMQNVHRFMAGRSRKQFVDVCAIQMKQLKKLQRGLRIPLVLFFVSEGPVMKAGLVMLTLIFL